MLGVSLALLRTDQLLVVHFGMHDRIGFLLHQGIAHSVDRKHPRP